MRKPNVLSSAHALAYIKLHEEKLQEEKPNS